MMLYLCFIVNTYIFILYVYLYGRILNTNCLFIIGYSSSQSIWWCPHNCGRSYKHKKSLTLHLKFECGVQPKFICENCFRPFKLKQHLKTHLMSCENHPPKFRCRICNKPFRQKIQPEIALINS